MSITAVRSWFLLVVGSLVLAGCGGADSAESDATSSRSAADDAAQGEQDAEADADAAAGDGAAGTQLAEQAEASLNVEMTEVGAKDGAGIPIPAGMRCTKSIPATCTAEISCPVADEASDEAEICRWLNLEGDKLLRTPRDPGAVCTQQYGGPEVLTVRGTINGQSLGGSKGGSTSDPKANDEPFRAIRTNGCEIARFESVAPLYLGSVPVQASNDAVDTPPDAGADPDASVSSPPHEPDVITDPPEAFGY